MKNQIFLVKFLIIFNYYGSHPIQGAHREHKVHNIVLYPDKHSWCKTLPIKQVISYPGCKSQEIDNNVCVGTCFSYSIPHTEPSDPGEVIVPYCDSCQPSDTTWQHVTLECAKNCNETPPQLIKRVQIINNCSCSSCEKNRNDNNNNIIGNGGINSIETTSSMLNNNNNNNNNNILNNYNLNNNNATGDDDDDNDGNDDDIIDDELLTTTYDDVPDLLNIINTRNETNSIVDSEHVTTFKTIMNHKLIKLLKNIQENNSQLDKNELMDLLRVIQTNTNINSPTSSSTTTTIDNKINDKIIHDFVESLNSENVELDVQRLREALTKFEETTKQQQQKQQNVDDNIDEIGDGLDGVHLNHGHLKGNHFGMGLLKEQQIDDNIQQSSTTTTTTTTTTAISSTNNNDSAIINNEKFTTKLDIDSNHQSPHNHQHHTNDNVLVDIDDNIKQQHHHTKHYHHHQQHHQQQHHQHQHHHQQHHIGDIVSGHGHLTRGPHGALVIEPDTTIQHEKLDVNPLELKPNHAGTLVSYSSHDKSKSLSLDD